MQDVLRAVRWRAVEFAVLFFAVPLAIAVLLPPGMMFPALFVGTLVGMVLLHATPGFAWRSLFVGVERVSLVLILLCAILTAVVGLGVLWVARPEAIFFLLQEGAPRTSGGWPIIWVIALFYPVVSALPQELVFRPLFFRRYGDLLPQGDVALVLNAGVFSLAHLMYWSWVVAVMTFAGGLLFAWSYERRANFPETVILHSVAGIVLFAVGMGVYFYSGNVVRPF